MLKLVFRRHKPVKNMKKYFDILKLDMSASIEEAEQAHKELIEAWRPESYQNLPRFKRKAALKLQEINDAYECIRSYLLAKQSVEAQNVFVPTADPAAESSPQIAPAEEPQRPPGTASRRKIPLLGLIALVVFAAALIIYLIADRKNLQLPKLQTNATEKNMRPMDSASPLVPAPPDHQKQAFRQNSAGNSVAEKQSPPSNTAKQKSPLQERSYNAARINAEALNRYNRYSLRVKKIQNGLITVGYNPGPIDGVVGPMTAGALKQFAGDHGPAIDSSGLLASDFTEAVLIFAEVAATHPDWDQIIVSKDFARWMDRQTDVPAYRIHQLKKSAPARQVIKILDLYKSDRKKLKPDR